MRTFKLHTFAPALPQVVWAKNFDTEFLFQETSSTQLVTTFSQPCRLGSLDLGDLIIGCVAKPMAGEFIDATLSDSTFIKNCFQLVSPLFVGSPDIQVKGAEFVARVFHLLSSTQRDWVGLYWRTSILGVTGLDSALVVGPYWGPPTPHTIISEQKGLCGRAIRENRTLNIDDVTKDSDFLACSVTTKSEIVIPIALPNGTVVAELDIDSNQFKAFDLQTQKALEAECKKFGLSLE